MPRKSHELLLVLLVCGTLTSSAVAQATKKNKPKDKNLRSQHALIVNPYDVDVDLIVESGAGTAVPLRVTSGSMAEFLCVKCTASLTTEGADGDVVEVKQELLEGKRYRIVWANARFELREVVAK